MSHSSRIVSAGSLGRAAAELALIVAGVLIALGVDGAMERARERQIAEESLVLIRNDLAQLVEQAVELAAYNASMRRATATVYGALAAEGRVERRTETWEALATLFGRRTVRFPRAAYDELVGTGNLRALAEEALRGDIVRFYENLAREEEVILRNNEAFTDGHLNELLLGKGLIVPLPPARSESPVPSMQAATDDAREFFPAGPTWEGRIWDLPPGDPDRRALRSTVVAVGRAVSTHLVTAEEVRSDAEALISRIDATLETGRGAPPP